MNGERNKADERKIRRRLDKKGKERQRVRMKATGREQGGRRSDGKRNFRTRRILNNSACVSH